MSIIDFPPMKEINAFKKQQLEAKQNLKKLFLHEIYRPNLRQFKKIRKYMIQLGLDEADFKILLDDFLITVSFEEK